MCVCVFVWLTDYKQRVKERESVLCEYLTNSRAGRNTEPE